MAVRYTEITKKDLEDPSLTLINQVIRDLVAEINRLGGQDGPITLESDLNMNGHNIINVADPSS